MTLIGIITDNQVCFENSNGTENVSFMNELSKHSTHTPHPPGAHHHDLTVCVYALLFASLYVAVAKVLRQTRGLNLHRGRTPVLAASRCISIVHATVSCAWAIVLILRKQGGWRGLAPQNVIDELCRGVNNTVEEEALICWSLGYFVADTVYMMLFEHDILFLLHHVFPIIIFTSALNAGTDSVLPLLTLALGEATGPFLGMRWLAKRAQNHWLNQILSRAFMISFLFIRLCVVPPYAVLLILKSHSGDINDSCGVVGWVYITLISVSVSIGVVWSWRLINKNKW